MGKQGWVRLGKQLLWGNKAREVSAPKAQNFSCVRGKAFCGQTVEMVDSVNTLYA